MPGRSRDANVLSSIGRLVFTLESMSYGSLKMDIGIPDVDALMTTLGSNADVLKAVFDDYVPEAFASSLQMGDNILEPLRFDTRISPQLVERMQDAQNEAAKPDAKERGTRFVASVVRSPLVFPILLIFFLWYLARQDLMAERQILSNLMQVTIQQQTATLSVMKDAMLKAREPEGKPASTANIATNCGVPCCCCLRRCR